ncbi:OBG-type G domain-containing protein [Balamuthia mandrillaris]
MASTSAAAASGSSGKLSSRHELLIGCVGKPSAGKSSFLNAATEANAKVGNYPFTTIEPNTGVTFYQTECPCKRYDLCALCKPRYGRCLNGTRFIPVKMLDVAGLVPGASEGKGLGNKFLDDLRHADVLLHIIDVSGTTNEKGEETTGYNPINDIEWLNEEIHAWIFNNLWKKWDGLVRRQALTKQPVAQVLQSQLSGYGTRPWQVARVLDLHNVKEPCEMDKWDEKMVRDLIKTFVEIRFPTIYVLNKIDHKAADANIAKISEKYGEEHVVPASALSECFLKKMAKTGYIQYEQGDEDFKTLEDLEEESDEEDGNAKPKPQLKSLDKDPKLKRQLEKIRDLVLFRYGGTGVTAAIKKAVEMKGFQPAYPVRNIRKFTCDRSNHVFRDCILLPPHATVRDFIHLIDQNMEKHLAYAEGVSGQRLGEDEVITPENNIIKFVMVAAKEQAAANGGGTTSGEKKG